VFDHLSLEALIIENQRFRGREDVFPVRWESKTTGKSGYSPVCANEWRASICQKPRIKCSDCAHRQYLPITDDVVYRHLSGEATMGVYALCEDVRRWYLGDA
jgi:hypothetical protein